MFVKNENPLNLNERLTAQQGTFLCPADLSSTFVDNLKAMNDWDSKDNVRKLCLDLGQDEASTFAQSLKDMNISFAALFPGLDGFGGPSTNKSGTTANSRGNTLDLVETEFRKISDVGSFSDFGRCPS